MSQHRFEGELRELKASDLQMVLAWRNHASIRRISTNSKVIKEDDHIDWYKTSNRTLKFIFEVNKRAVGVVLLTNIAEDTWSWSFYLAPSTPRGCGLGTLMTVKALDCLRSIEAKKVVALIKASNRVSLKLHEKLGFVFKQANKLGKVKVFVYEYDLKGEPK